MPGLAFFSAAFAMISHPYLGVFENLLGLLVAGVLLAEAAVLVHLETIGIVLLVLHGIVIALLALRARERDLDALIRCQIRHLPLLFDAAPAEFAAAVTLVFHPHIAATKQQPTTGAD